MHHGCPILTCVLISAGGRAQKYTYQVTPSCGSKPTIPIFTVRNRFRRDTGKEPENFNYKILFRFTWDFTDQSENTRK